MPGSIWFPDGIIWNDLLDGTLRSEQQTLLAVLRVNTEIPDEKFPWPALPSGLLVLPHSMFYGTARQPATRPAVSGRLLYWKDGQLHPSTQQEKSNERKDRVP
jgi:hypothetical protein